MQKNSNNKLKDLDVLPKKELNKVFSQFIKNISARKYKKNIIEVFYMIALKVIRGIVKIFLKYVI
jgi:hypothetical protein